MALNELRDGMQDTLPPTDSRRRPDVRILEQGNIGMGNKYISEHFFLLNPKQ